MAETNEQCKECFGFVAGIGCSLLKKTEPYPCFAFKTPEEARASGERAYRKLVNRGLSKYIELYKLGVEK